MLLIGTRRIGAPDIGGIDGFLDDEERRIAEAIAGWLSHFEQMFQARRDSSQNIRIESAEDDELNQADKKDKLRLILLELTEDEQAHLAALSKRFNAEIKDENERRTK